MSGLISETKVHRRLNLLTGRHVIVSPHRSSRPWQGQIDPTVRRSVAAHDPACHLCPGNARASGVRNPNYDSVYIFDNDYPALSGCASEHGLSTDQLFVTEPCVGANQVICYSPDHSRSLGTLSETAIEAIVDGWCESEARLSRHFANVQIFENRGAMMGASSPHPHGQIWATAHIPDEMGTEDAHQRAYLETHGRALLDDVVERELASGERVVIANNGWVALVPFWAAWPFETLVVPRFAAARLADLAIGDRRDLAELLGALVRCYDALFDVPFPYSMGWHGAPASADPTPWRLHAHFYPPLLRSANIRKFMVGYEMLAEAQRDLTPEEAAARLRDAR